MHELLCILTLVLAADVEELGEQTNGRLRTDVDRRHERERVREHKLGR